MENLIGKYRVYLSFQILFKLAQLITHEVIKFLLSSKRQKEKRDYCKNTLKTIKLLYLLHIELSEITPYITAQLQTSLATQNFLPGVQGAPASSKSVSNCDNSSK